MGHGTYYLLNRMGPIKLDNVINFAIPQTTAKLYNILGKAFFDYVGGNLQNILNDFLLDYMGAVVCCK